MTTEHQSIISVSSLKANRAFWLALACAALGCSMALVPAARGEDTPVRVTPAETMDKLPAADKPSKADEKIDNQELDQGLLNDKADAAAQAAQSEADKKIKAAADNMARSKIRLTDLRDPGETTQKIQQRVMSDLDVLIEEARKASASPPPPPSKSKGDKPGDPKPGQGQPENQGDGSKPGPPKPGGTTAAQDDTLSAGNENNATLNDAVKETAQSWGSTSPRIHDAVMEARTEHVLERDKNLVEDYYRALATKATEKK